MLIERVIPSPTVKPSQHEGKEGKSGCTVLEDGARAIAGFGQARNHKWAIHFGKPGEADTQFICLQAHESPHRKASSCMTGVMSRKKSITMSLCHRVGDPFGNREDIWKTGSELPVHLGSMSGVRLDKHIPPPAAGTTDTRPQTTHCKNHLPRICLSKLLWVCQQLSCVTSAWSPAFCSKQLPSCFCAEFI